MEKNYRNDDGNDYVAYSDTGGIRAGGREACDFGEIDADSGWKADQKYGMVLWS